MRNTYKKAVAPIYVVNIIFQAFVSLISPAAFMLLIAFLLDRYTSVGGWIYPLLITLGTVAGFFSMISFVLRAMTALEAIEKQNADKKSAKKGTNQNESAE